MDCYPKLTRMKYDIEHLTLGKKRTLKAMTSALVELLKKKEFSGISVTEICEVCMLPKSTFYNYFDDKYDLLNFFFDTLRYYVISSYSPSKYYEAEASVDKMLEGVDLYHDEILAVIRRNPLGSEFYWLLSNYLFTMYERVLQKNPSFVIDELPGDIQTRIGAQTFLTVLYWAIPAGKTAAEIKSVIQITSLHK